MAGFDHGCRQNERGMLTRYRISGRHVQLRRPVENRVAPSWTTTCDANRPRVQA